MSKYDPLEEFLKNKVTVTLSYDEIEKILCFKLPDSAYVHSEWWDNGTDNHVQMHSWWNSGWKVIDKKLGESVTFQKFEWA